ncbi:molybdopterin molybdotransferase MoeA [candidate division KSB1 bacterium]|nr:molybdopterin molybdotransferase MoeA [candidate division KSB1 bacterium]
MISIPEAKALIDPYRPKLRTMSIPLDEAVGRTLVKEIHATRPSPACDNSAMDGFAVRCEDAVQGASLEIIGESGAGLPCNKTVDTGTTVRINTGAKVPLGVSAVVPLEDCLERDGRIVIEKAVKRMQHIRLAGEEFKKSDILLLSGTTLHAPQISLLAFLGISQVTVYRPPKVNIIVTGEELVSPETSMQDFQIHDSNAPMLTAALKDAGVLDVFTHRIGDDFEETVHTIQKAESKSDFILVTGGVSVGPHDHVKEAAKQGGFKQIFWKVRQKPGMPFFFAVKDEKLLFGLPGNPVSAFLNYLVYIDPLVRGLLNPSYQPKTVKARSKQSLHNKGDRTRLLRVILHNENGKLQFSTPSKQNSHMISSIATTHGYIFVQPDEEIKIDQGVLVNLYPWSS